MPRLLASAASRFRQRLVRDGAYGVGLNFFFQDFDKAVTDALDYARGRRQGGGDREGHVPVNEAQVCCSRVYGLVKLFFLGGRILSWRVSDRGARRGGCRACIRTITRPGLSHGGAGAFNPLSHYYLFPRTKVGVFSYPKRRFKWSVNGSKR